MPLPSATSTSDPTRSPLRRTGAGAGPAATGADPSVLLAVPRHGEQDAATLRRACRRVAAAADRLRATSDVGRVDATEVLACCERLAEGVARLDAWVGRVGAALHDADLLPPTVHALRLLRLRDELGGRPAASAAATPDLGALWPALDPATLDDEALALLAAGPDVPLGLRDAAGREAVERHLDGLALRLAALDRRIEDLDDEQGWLDRLASRIDRLVDDVVLDRLAVAADLVVQLHDRRERLDAEVRTLQGVLREPGWTVLGFTADAGGPDGDSTLRVALGDVTTATHVAVLVPGTTSGTHRAASALRDTRELHAAASVAALAAGGDRRVATVLELHDAPDDLARAAATAHAAAAAPRLAGLVAELAGRGARTTVVAHSHGAVVAGHAARGGLDADAVVLLGAPGTGLGHARQARLRDDGAVWAVRAPGDPIGLVPAAGRVASTLPPELRGRLPEVLTRPGGLHGPDPALPAFGAGSFAVDAACEADPVHPEVMAPQPRGHLRYLAAGTATLVNTARVVVGTAPSPPCHQAGH